ncbi:MAG: tetratricopeptide repeat protein [Planctomycetes bacterium]|nr:tetratricopeptide repeat protein [Planctomycetota bacterium]
MRLSTAFRRLLLVLAFASHAYAGAPEPAKPVLPQPKLETVAVIVDKAEVKSRGKVVATVEKGRMFGVIARRGDQVEVQACVDSDIRRGTLPISAVKFLTDDDIDLAGEWLKMAKDINPKLDVAACRAKLDALIERVAAAAAKGKTPREKARLIGVQLFGQEGFSFRDGVKALDRVLNLKQGDCSSLSFLYVCIGQRLEMPLCVVAPPSHVFIRYSAPGGRFNIETTREGKLHNSDSYLREHLGAVRFSQVSASNLASLPAPRALGVLFNVWGVALGGVGERANECGKYAKAIEINPQDATPYYNWGVALDEVERPLDACVKYAKAVELDPRDAEAYSNWGGALCAIGKPAEACEKYEKAVQIDPHLAKAYWAWAIALRCTRRHAEAIEKLDKAAELDPALKPKVEELRKELMEKK